jgi:hypothetical protein
LRIGNIAFLFRDDTGIGFCVIDVLLGLVSI